MIVIRYLQLQPNSPTSNDWGGFAREASEKPAEEEYFMILGTESIDDKVNTCL